MKRVGIARPPELRRGALDPAAVVENRLAFMTPEWKKAFRFAAAEADRNGLELAIAASPGWSETGGPWVQPKDGMKKLVWSETEIAGGQRFTGRLAAPPSVTGPFQDLPFDPGIAGAMGKPFVPPTTTRTWPSSRCRFRPRGEPAAATYSDGKGQPLDAKALTDGDLKTTIELPAEGAAIVVAYEAPQTIRSASLFVPAASSCSSARAFAPRLEVSDDGKAWRKVSEIPASVVPTTVSFAPVSAARFRVVFAPNPESGREPHARRSRRRRFVLRDADAGSEDDHGSASSGCPPEARVNQFEAKAGFHVEHDYYALDGDVGSDAQGRRPRRGDRPDQQAPAGRPLDWTPPPGRWQGDPRSAPFADRQDATTRRPRRRPASRSTSSMARRCAGTSRPISTCTSTRPARNSFGKRGCARS